MNRTFLKDTLREIRKSPGRFLAIVAIIALGTAFFVGIKTTSPDMKLTADRYFKAQGFMDFQLVSTVGFTDEDLLAIEKTEGVQLAVPTFSIDAVATVGENQKVLRIGSFAAENSIDRPLLVEGRLPETSGECAIEKNALTNIDYHPGDRILLESGSKSSLADRLATDEFTVVGIINSPLYLSKERGSTTIGNGQVSAFMLIPEQDFLQKYYSGITIAAKDSADVQAYTKAYDDRMAPLKSALETIAVQRAELRSQTIQVDSIPKVEWFVLDRNMNTGYVEYGSAADRMDAIAQVFPVLFILVAILICFASMSRMVEEQRQFMGTVKALGYSRTTIALKFLAYAVSASIIGGIIGLTVGFNLFPRTIFQAYSILYTVPKLILIFDIPFAMIAFAVGIGVTALSALLVCLGELGTSAATLMRPRAPKPGKVILLERIGPVWRRLSFIHKVTARNLFRYKSRFLMTVIGVCGCTALLLVGLGLSDVITTIGDKQFGELFTYQAAVGLENDIRPEDRAALETAIRQQPDFESMQNRLSEPVEVAFQGTSKNVSLMVPENAGDMTRFI
ncbi:MAG TPA: ABC transporter permease, partial [Clostridia bacterium]